MKILNSEITPYKFYINRRNFNSGLGAAKVSSNKPDNSKANQYIE